MRRAEWRRRADDPTGAPGWWVKGTFRKRNLHWVFLWPVLVATAMGLLGAGWWMLLASFAAWGFIRTRPVKEWDPLHALLPDPPPPGQFRASVAYRRDGVRIGTDDMALTVVDGWLYAEGVRSHFSLRRDDVTDLRTGSDRRGRLAVSDGSDILLSGIDDEARIVLERWWQTKTFGGGEPTFPPARPHPEEAARWLGRGLASFLVLAALVLATNAVSDKVAKGFLLLFDFSFIFLVLLPLRRRQRPFAALMGEEGPDALWRWRTRPKALEEPEEPQGRALR